MAPERRQLVVRDGGRTFVVPHADIVWIEAEDNCARIHTRGRTILVRESLRALADSLESNGFVRTHRSAIVNVVHVRRDRAAVVRRSAADSQRRRGGEGKSHVSGHRGRSRAEEAAGSDPDLTPGSDPDLTPV